jgi:hypothetical protein
MQPTGRAVPNSVRALLAAGDQRNLELCGRGLEGLQLICKSLGRNKEFTDGEGHHQAGVRESTRPRGLATDRFAWE